MASLPKPGQIRNEMDALQRLVDPKRFVDSYEWHYYDSLQRSQTGDANTPIANSAVSDPTGSVAVNDKQRRHLELAAAAVKRGTSCMIVAWRELEQAGGGREPRDGMREALAGENLLQAELDSLHEAQARRKARGEDFGEG